MPRRRRDGGGVAGGRVAASTSSSHDKHVTLDAYYASVYGDRWPALRAALLTPPRKAALWNRCCQLPFADVMRGLVRADAASTLPVFVKDRTHGGATITTTAAAATAATQDDKDNNNDDHQHDDDDDSDDDIAPPPCDDFHSRAYYLLDFASALVVEQLAVRPCDRVLDLCAAPGGKSVALCQCLSPSGVLVANDVRGERAARLQRTLRAHVPPTYVPWTVTQRDAQTWHEPEAYTRVLVDAPCSSERHVLLQQLQQTRVHNSSSGAVAVAVPLRVWSRASSVQMASLQRTLLLRALETCCVGGRVVYSTCSLSPYENDGVVTAALASTRCGVTVVRPRYACASGTPPSRTDADEGAEVASVLPSFVEATQHGSLVLPDRAHGWGPMYFCILHKHAATRPDTDSDTDSDDNT